MDRPTAKKFISLDLPLTQKQTFRNRTEIYGANGKLKLTVPIHHTHGGVKSLDKEVCIAYDMDWQKQHWKSICAAYRSAPYFEFYEADLKSFYQEKKVLLFDFNLSLLTQIMALLDLSFSYEIVGWNPDKQKRMDHLILAKSQEAENFDTYTQVFGTKFGFYTQPKYSRRFVQSRTQQRCLFKKSPRVN